MNDDVEELLAALLAERSVRIDIPAVTIECFLLDDGQIAARAVPPGQHPPVVRLVAMAVIDALAFERARHDDSALRDWLRSAAWDLS